MGKKKGEEYYLKKEGEKGNGLYISKKNITMVERLAQKDYDLSLLKMAEELNRRRRKLLVEAVLSEEEYVRRWEAVEYEGKKLMRGHRRL